ncbi:hypothetical protein F4561_000338 [Lipingzhangella halophila]|uniref:Phytanoyl-CoA dioxygenase n=1 Tax=Lipingzhangella halophila TaxID=1783352 RepID=A0A7W7W0R7_9ACTN|nr:phytanoyl-CoA dioxygenase family protein [Lipingzhangella halophila]MBB4929518.1 hypothetical protein [Lipingzhangella halophila]
MALAALSGEEVERFVADGFVKLAGAFPRELADEGRAMLWKATGKDPDDPTTWTAPVVRLGGFGHRPFYLAANTDRLHCAYDQLVGRGRWVEPNGLGTFPIRFPHPDDPGDTGWHVDAGFHIAEDESDGPLDYAALDIAGYRTNIYSRNRALLMLFLFSDVGEDDAPTRVRVGSHLDLPPLLEPFGEKGINIDVDAPTAHRPVALATGRAGDVYLCHPFLAHAAQPHRGSTPKFMAQPPLDPADELRLKRPPFVPYSPVERAVLRGLGRE